MIVDDSILYKSLRKTKKASTIIVISSKFVIWLKENFEYYFNKAEILVGKY
jgi:hypothetical protein